MSSGPTSSAIPHRPAPGTGQTGPRPFSGTGAVAQHHARPSQGPGQHRDPAMPGPRHSPNTAPITAASFHVAHPHAAWVGQGEHEQQSAGRGGADSARSGRLAGSVAPRPPRSPAMDPASRITLGITLRSRSVRVIAARIATKSSPRSELGRGRAGRLTAVAANATPTARAPQAGIGRGSPPRSCGSDRGAASQERSRHVVGVHLAPICVPHEYAGPTGDPTISERPRGEPMGDDADEAAGDDPADERRVRPPGTCGYPRVSAGRTGPTAPDRERVRWLLEAKAVVVVVVP